MRRGCLIGINKPIFEFLYGCLYFLISQSIDNWVQNGRKDGVKHRQDLFYHKAVLWPHVNEYTWAKKHDDNSEVSCTGRKGLR
jgi:hypothetical protein